MNIKLHNKFEITHNGRTITAYNTLLHKVYDKIANLEQYTSHIALGTGTDKVDFSQDKLGRYLMSFKTETDEAQCDITKETLFIRKVVTIPEEYPTEITFSELGLACSDQFDPEIYNHVLLTNIAGEPVSITRIAGEALEIKVTIYLELTNQGKGLFTKGDNLLIHQILGDELELEDTNLYACRGENLFGNELTDRVTPDLSQAVICQKEVSTDDNGLLITFSADLGEGATEELLMVYGGKVVLRLNTLEANAPKSQTSTITSLKANVLELGEYVKEVTNVSTGGEEESNYTLTKYGSKLTDKIEDLFDQNFTESSTRFVSNDGNMIAFVDSAVHLYKYSNYHFEKLNAIQMPSTNIQKMFIFKDRILMLMTDEPYIRIFDIVDNNVIERGVDLTFYQTTFYPYSWLDAAATLSEDNKILLALIINNQEHTPLVLRFSQNPNTTYYDSIEKPKSVGALKTFAIDKTPWTSAFVAFITDKYLGQDLYAIEQFDETSSSLGKSSEIALSLVQNSTELLTSGRAVMSQTSIYPFLKVYFYPNFDVSADSFTTGIKHYVSKDGNYIIAKYGEGDYKIFNFHNIDNLEEFVGGFPSYVKLIDVLSFEFVGDLLLVFTNQNVYGCAIKNSMTRLDNVSKSQSEYSVQLSKYNLMGSKTFEGVALKLTLSFQSPTKINLQDTSKMVINSFNSLDDCNIEGAGNGI